MKKDVCSVGEMKDAEEYIKKYPSAAIYHISALTDYKDVIISNIVGLPVSEVRRRKSLYSDTGELETNELNDCLLAYAIKNKWKKKHKI